MSDNFITCLSWGHTPLTIGVYIFFYYVSLSSLHIPLLIVTSIDIPFYKWNLYISSLGLHYCLWWCRPYTDPIMDQFLKWFYLGHLCTDLVKNMLKTLLCRSYWKYQAPVKLFNKKISFERLYCSLDLYINKKSINWVAQCKRDLTSKNNKFSRTYWL
jgi:hypothetical protein